MRLLPLELVGRVLQVSGYKNTIDVVGKNGAKKLLGKHSLQSLKASADHHSCIVCGRATLGHPSKKCRLHFHPKIASSEKWNIRVKCRTCTYPVGNGRVCGSRIGVPRNVDLCTKHCKIKVIPFQDFSSLDVVY